MVWTISLQSLHGNSCRSRTSVLFYCNLCSIVSVGLMLVQCTRYCRSRIVHALYCAPAHTASKSIGSIKTLYYVLQQLFLFRYWWKQTLLSSNIEYTIGVISVIIRKHHMLPLTSSTDWTTFLPQSVGSILFGIPQFLSWLWPRLVPST